MPLPKGYSREEIEEMFEWLEKPKEVYSIEEKLSWFKDLRKHAIVKPKYAREEIEEIEDRFAWLEKPHEHASMKVEPKKPILVVVDVHPQVQDLPDDLDWDIWGENAVCLHFSFLGTLKIYVINPNDCSCYHLTDFFFSPPDQFDVTLAIHNHHAACTLIGGKVYLIGRKDPDDHFATDMWIWDIAEGQKKKLNGESPDWVQGPRLNAPKATILAFSLGEYLFALDIRRSFWSSRIQGSSSIDFERIKVSSDSVDHLLPWQSLPLIEVERGCCIVYIGSCCVGDSKFILHMRKVDEDYDNYFFCFNVHTMEWIEHKFSGLPLTNYAPDYITEPPLTNYDSDYITQPELDKISVLWWYGAQVQNHGLFFHPPTGKLSVFDFSLVFNLLEFPSILENDYFEYPYFDLDTDKCNALNDIEDRLPEDMLTWQTFHVGGKKFLCVVMFIHSDNSETVWICSVDIKEESKEIRLENKKEKIVCYSANSDVEKVWKIGMSVSDSPIRKQ